MDRIIARACAAVLTLVLAACSVPENAVQGNRDLGDFQLCGQFVTFVANDPGPLSRKATEDEWVNALNAEIARQLGPYKGGKCYTVSVAVEGYGLAQPGVPLVFSPKSGLLVRAFVFDNDLIEAGVPSVLNKGGEQLQVALVDQGGLFNDRDAQLGALARTGVAEVVKWMERNPEWFDGDGNAELAARQAAGR